MLRCRQPIVFQVIRSDVRQSGVSGMLSFVLLCIPAPGPAFELRGIRDAKWGQLDLRGLCGGALFDAKKKLGTGPTGINPAFLEREPHAP